MVLKLKQNTFDFPYSDNYAKDNFIVGEVNSLAYQAITSWPHWDKSSRFSNIRIIVGAKRSGKTHLANIWSAQTQGIFLQIEDPNVHHGISPSGCYIIEDIELISSQHYTNLLHIINAIADHPSSYLLMTSGSEINNLQVTLPDLRSRLKAILSFTILPPDDNLLSTILIKLASDRQIHINHSVIKYVITRIARDYESILKFLNLVDDDSLRNKKDITIHTARKILNNMNV